MNLTEDNIRAVLILEVLGKPPEHLTETLHKLADSIGKEENIELKEKKVKEPVEMEKRKGFYTSFAEIEIQAKTIMHLIMIIFKYMPAHVEILSPENIKINNNNLGELFNELTRRLHGYDEIARMVQIEKKILTKKLREVLEKEKAEKSEKSEQKAEEKK
jgi:hypothetical protein